MAKTGLLVLGLCASVPALGRDEPAGEPTALDVQNAKEQSCAEKMNDTYAGSPYRYSHAEPEGNGAYRCFIVARDGKGEPINQAVAWTPDPPGFRAQGCEWKGLLPPPNPPPQGAVLSRRAYDIACLVVATADVHEPFSWLKDPRRRGITRSAIAVSEATVDGRRVRLITTNNPKVHKVLTERLSPERPDHLRIYLLPDEVFLPELEPGPTPIDTSRTIKKLHPHERKEKEHAEDVAMRWFREQQAAGRMAEDAVIRLGSFPKACGWCTEEFCNNYETSPYVSHEWPQPGWDACIAPVPSEYADPEGS